MDAGVGVGGELDDSRESSEEAMAAVQAKGMVAEEVVGVEGEARSCIWNVCWRWGRSVLWMSWAWR